MQAWLVALYLKTLLLRALAAARASSQLSFYSACSPVYSSDSHTSGMASNPFAGVIKAARTAPTSAWSIVWCWLTLYRQLFAWCVAFNLIAAVVAAAGAWDWAFRHRVQFAVTNTLVTVLTRNEVSCRHLVYPINLWSLGRPLL